MKKFLKWFGLLLVLSICGLTIYGFLWIRQYQQLAEEEPAITLSPSLSDITYCTMDGVPLKMDLYYPNETQPPYQVLVYVHGGSFTGGDKRKGSGVIDIPAMTGRGYAVAALNYRLMPEYPFPAEVIDAKCAIRFLRAHTEKYNLLTEKIGIWGGSAGGHLSTMVGLTNGDPAFELGENGEYSSQVDAVVDMFGPTDLTQPMGWLQRLLLRRAFGTDSPSDQRLIAASPIQYVTLDVAPFLIIHGDQDTAVPLEQSQILYEKLLEADGEATLVIVENANHNFKPTGGPIKPTRAEISDMLGNFFDQWLK
ncbi:MAG TPA: alpha/beta hydrolase [Anaerolineales bacterium]|nr:alpha/beta hydrolase [Anaerolineales bacterium]